MKTWSLSWHGLRTVTALELRQRVRSRRWLIALICWFVVIGAMTTLVITVVGGLRRFDMPDEMSKFGTGPLAFGLITLFVLGMGLVIAPTFTATSINGDRNQGTLATLQATRLSAMEIALGKLAAAWLTALAFLITVIPFIAWSMVLGNISFWQVLVCFLVVFAEIAVICAVGLGWSALLSRPAGSAVMTYLTVVFLSIITLVVEALSVSLVINPHGTQQVYGLSREDMDAYYEKLDEYYFDIDSEGYTVTNPAMEPPIDKCAWYTETDTYTYHTDKIWWMVVPNPFVIVADAAPLPPNVSDTMNTYVAYSGDLLAAIRVAVAGSRQATPPQRDDCIWLYETAGYQVITDIDTGEQRVETATGQPVDYVSPVQPTRAQGMKGGDVWYWGLASNILLGAFFFWIAVRRLKVPYRTLAKGTRVA
ncbi:MAG: ABC transporter permease [Propionibacteriaceae bacterium]|jgi:ABC-type transport system involved in multi-copper enzyme maturation permease subunit|nr:ABC transporter permease [Propionibacteriaceae bacterium]